MVYDYLSHMTYCIVKGKEEALFVTEYITVLRTWSSTVTQTLGGVIQKPETAKRTMYFEEERKREYFEDKNCRILMSIYSGSILLTELIEGKTVLKALSWIKLFEIALQ